MSRTVFCALLQENLPAMEQQPFPGALGEKVFNEVSQAAWLQWLNHQTMLINEYRLNLLDKKAKDFLKQEMEKFFFAGGSEKPEGFVESDA